MWSELRTVWILAGSMKCEINHPNIAEFIGSNAGESVKRKYFAER